MKNIIWINLLAGLWLIFAPFGLVSAGLAGVWAANGIILTSLWIYAAVPAPVGTAWFQTLCGVWLLVAPFVLGYHANSAATTSDAVCGVVTIAISVATAWALKQPVQV
jgi:hypothetical protein